MLPKALTNRPNVKCRTGVLSEWELLILAAEDDFRRAGVDREDIVAAAARAKASNWHRRAWTEPIDVFPLWTS